MSLWRWIIGIVVVAVLAAGGATWAVTAHRQTQSRVSVAFPEGVGAVVPLGLPPGNGPNITSSTANPLADDPSAVAEGKKLFRSMNCAGCHGYDAKGGMGPDLTDTEWRYGGTPIEVFKSIYEGRPQGMPAWGNALPTRPVWELVAYIQSLGGTVSSPPPGTSPVTAQSGQGQ